MKTQRRPTIPVQKSGRSLPPAPAGLTPLDLNEYWLIDAYESINQLEDWVINWRVDWPCQCVGCLFYEHIDYWVSEHFPRTFPPDFPPDEKLYMSWTTCHKSNFYLLTELFPSIQLPFQQRTFFIKCKGRLIRSIFGLISSFFNVFATQKRFLSPFQLLVNNALFHQSSF